MTAIFCPKCHRRVCDVVDEFVKDPQAPGGFKEITKIMQGKKTLINLGRGGRVKGLSVTCPVGHKVLVDKHLPQPKPLPKMLEWWRPPPHPPMYISF